MIDFIKAYIKRIDQLYHTKEATEHSYRSALEELVRNCTGYKNVINEQKHINCGAPDLTINNNKDIPLAYIEAKDIDGGDLDGRKKNKEQFDRYKAALHTIIFTDYIDFHLYEDGSFVKKAELAYSDNGHIYLNEDAIPHFISIIEHLKNLQPQTISSPSKLATLMANKAKMIAEAVRLDLKNDKEKKGSLHTQLEAFKNILDKTLNEEKFADLYAQTVAYGLFAAQERGLLFIGPGEKVYAGMVVGQNPRSEDIEVNVCKTKKLTNTRASGSDEALKLVPKKQMSLEQCLEFIDTDELLEITPENLRIRKKILDSTKRKRSNMGK